LLQLLVLVWRWRRSSLELDCEFGLGYAPT
jgi:hypothetical protein